MDPVGFKTYSVTTDGHGNASDPRACFSGEGPDLWFTAGSMSSNHLSWTTSGIATLSVVTRRRPGTGTR